MLVIAAVFVESPAPTNIEKTLAELFSSALSVDTLLFWVAL